MEGSILVRWLQISDLHIKERADWINFEQELAVKCGELGNIDLVIVTGDLPLCFILLNIVNFYAKRAGRKNEV